MYDDRYGFAGLFDIRDCADCGHLHVAANLEPHHLARLYAQFYPRSGFSLDDFAPHSEISGWRSWWNGERSAAFRWVPRDVRVLDVGCGFGETLAYHRRRGCEVYGVEADENIRRVAERFDLNVHVGLFDASLYPADFFEFVTLDQVVEHSTDPNELLRGVARVLKPGGTAILTTPNPRGIGARVFGRFWLHWHVPYHLQFFTRRSMQIAARQAGLEVERTRTVTSSEWMHYQWLHGLSYPKPGTRSAFWSRDAQPQFLYRGVYRLLAKLHAFGVNHLITRILDALRLGDNRLYFLRRPAGLA